MNPWVWRRRKKTGVTEAFIYNDTFTVGFMLIAGVDTKEGNRLLLKHGMGKGGNNFELEEDFWACCIHNPTSDSHAIAISRKLLNGGYTTLVSCIAHECVHLANHSLIPRGMRPKYNNDEPQAYFVSWAMKSILETLRK